MQTLSFKILTKSTMLLMVSLSLLITTYYVKAAIGDLLSVVDNPSQQPQLSGGDFFGGSLAVTPSGDLVVGAYSDDTAGLSAGAVHLFSGITNEVLLTITNPNPIPGGLGASDHFGESVAVAPNGDILVGAPFDREFADNPSDGSVYLFDGTTGALKLTINNPAAAEGGGRFGYSVATTPNGDLLVGALYNGSDIEGVAYLFDGTTGTLLLIINNPTPKSTDGFGSSVALTPGGNFLIGAPADDTGAVNAGSAYLFDGITGALLLTINNPTPAIIDLFGQFVAVAPNGDLLISAHLDNTVGTDAGSVYLFDGTTGALKLTINNPAPEDATFFGSSVATTLDGDLLIGSYNNDISAIPRGSAYLFDGITGELLITMDSSSTENNDFFGFSVATTQNGNLLVGAPRTGTLAQSTGSVYLFAGIHSQSINTPPILDTIGNKNVEEGQLLEFIITASDIDVDNLTFSAFNLPTGATFDANTATFSWIPSFEDAGNYTDVEFTVTDDGAPIELDVELITITVGNVNRAPIFDFVGPQEVMEETFLEFTVVTTDLDGDTVIISANGLPVGATFNTETGVFNWTPDLTQEGVYVVSFFATDNGTPSEIAQLDAIITVGDNPTPVEQAEDIVNRVILDNFVTNIENSYLSNLKKVKKFIKDGKITPALNQLYAFINKVQGDLASGIIDQATADMLINSANALIDVLSV